ncbi:hypothetical protein EHS39_12330 [Ensifer sp. MPMI2T]|nr:hypothetical protein EHS39_12330 [Ensifer sp. MPMI2T]
MDDDCSLNREINAVSDVVEVWNKPCEPIPEDEIEAFARRHVAGPSSTPPDRCSARPYYAECVIGGPVGGEGLRAMPNCPFTHGSGPSVLP